MAQRDALIRLKAEVPAILPSLLMCDFANLEREIRALERAQVKGLHLDVMDGHFVPNLTYGLPVVEAIRRVTDLPLDVHLMIDHPGRYVEQFRAAGADGITVHAEAVEDPRPVLRQIRATGAAAGLAINPPTPVAAVERFVDDCDLVLVMSVAPGFGGQPFDPVALDKLQTLRQMVGRSTLLEVDGGVDYQTVGPCAAAGAGLLVAGSAIFRSGDYTRAVARLAELAAAAGVGCQAEMAE
ncbi:MAG: ribulose-phosphate 3-epimerase [Planctomycetes bacterium RBG_16_64_10]|nr:MAG: ribulose-phosphate 3-epimerase [Planctomycetes bacterium RBG_16_64_10]